MCLMKFASSAQVGSQIPARTYTFPQPTSTTPSPADAYIDDPANSATSESSSGSNTGDSSSSSASESSEEDDDRECHSCFGVVEATQENIAYYTHLIDKHRKLVRKIKAEIESKRASDKALFRKSKQSEASNAKQSQNKHTHKINSDAFNATRAIRTLPDYGEDARTRIPDQHIIVSRLIIKRSTTSDNINNNNNTRNKQPVRSRRRSNDDLQVKKLKHKIHQQANSTCYSLYDVQHCLNEISQVCHGNLHFHSIEVFARQWFERLNCPPSKDPTFKPFSELIRSIPKWEESSTKVPTVRLISADEDVRRRLDALFGGQSGPAILGIGGGGSGGGGIGSGAKGVSGSSSSSNLDKSNVDRNMYTAGKSINSNNNNMALNMIGRGVELRPTMRAVEQNLYPTTANILLVVSVAVLCLVFFLSYKLADRHTPETQ